MAKRDYVAEALSSDNSLGGGPLSTPPPPPARSWRDSVINAQDLCDKRFPELKSIVPGIFFEGVILLASRPKLGKTWLLLQISTAIANGVMVLVSDGRTPAHGDVLWLNLEDGERRAQRRMSKYFGALRENWPKRLTIARTWRRLNEGGLDDIRGWCKSVEKPLLVSIDTLKRVRPPKRNGQSDYDADYEACQGLLQLAHEFPGLTFIVAHHDRKMDAEDVFDTISGTLGLTGGVDTVAVLKRTQGGVSLHVEGRDLLDTIEKAIRFDRETCRWVVLGEAADVHRSAERKRVLGALKAGPLDVGEIKAAAELKSRDAADKLLQRMAQDGQIERLSRGTYGLPQSDPASEAESEDRSLSGKDISVAPGVSDGSDGPLGGSAGAPAIPLNGVRKSETHKRPDGTGTNGSDSTSDAGALDIPIFLDRRRIGLGPAALGPGGRDDDVGYLDGGQP